MRDRVSEADDMLLVGGALCLDFANTVDWRGTERVHDWLATYEDLVWWAKRAGALDSTAADRLLARAAMEPAAARTTLGRALSLREAIYNVASAAAGHHSPTAEALSTLNRHMFGLLARTRLTPESGGFTRDWAGAADVPDRVLWPVAWSAFDLLNGEDVNRLRECANADCRWLFVDRSRNRSRRWCDMRNCGNVMKARRHRGRSG
ncbi:ABATE domain-containing protein [Rhodospirillaceae bacterium SYSU D60014]|uniref:CGNR zinc finger domain-containing protein n=1 Tax=Virgifigura deserti TaxID=2268457 RepID=UPI0013C49846